MKAPVTSATTPSEMVLTWIAPTGGSPQPVYQPRFQVTGATTWIPYGSPVAGLSVIITGLSAATSYDWDVAGASRISLTPALAEIEEHEPAESGIVRILRKSMRAIVRRLARCPGELYDVEWRDMERMLREVFEGLGFTTRLTPGAKDGGFDLELLSPAGLSYLVEVKHWSPRSLVGDGVINHFTDVVVTEQAERGLLLSSSGFTQKALLGRVEVEQYRVALGDSSKVISLCTEYVWKPNGILISKRWSAKYTICRYLLACMSLHVH